MGISPAAAGLLGGMSGGIAQAYATMGEFILFCINFLFAYVLNKHRFHDLYENG
jgi:hypothetical protein